MAHPVEHMTTLDQAAQDTGDLESALPELIRVHASQLNRCTATTGAEVTSRRLGQGVSVDADTLRRRARGVAVAAG